ncbi:hypothetical protein GCM10011409_38700 [Lentibacillus populi]|uniref:Uncharacterized protein n=1 Tax=Lentibacillus populi TaxID=1827502 RepID=A0A9W5X718_9BACI|nr:hypothetical protein GCM10011409_38700 [Lentibacillus populi]
MPKLNRCENSAQLTTKLTESWLEAGFKRGNKGKSYGLSASIDHIEMVTVEILLSMTVPPTITVGLGINATMLAFRYTLGATMTGGSVSGVGCGDDGCTVTGNVQIFHIPEQSQLS